VTTFDGTGAFSVSTYGNDVITCDQAGNSRWKVTQIFSDGTSQFNVYQFTDGVAANLDSLAVDNSAAVAYQPNAVVTNPSGDQTVTQPGSTFLNINRLNCTGTCTGFGSSFTLNGLATNPQTVRHRRARLRLRDRLARQHAHLQPSHGERDQARRAQLGRLVRVQREAGGDRGQQS
jgi:hypothetical protein